MNSVSLQIPSPGRYFLFALLLIAPVCALSALSVAFLNSSDSELASILYETFWVGEETNVPTFLNFFLLFSAASLLLGVANRAFLLADRWRWHWLGFASLLTLMAFDEASQMHEVVGGYLTQDLDLGGFLQWEWVLVGASVVAILAVLGFQFVRNLPPSTRTYVFLAAAFFVGGALGLESISAFLIYNDLGFARWVILMEEACEMTGAALFGSAALANLTSMHRARAAT